ncbi:MAG TPA: hypothetical protein VNA12_10505 [Mycobacteriales bacterium]|nr:hypothetical protein [Mycobacteriales bacterium]
MKQTRIQRTVRAQRRPETAPDAAVVRTRRVSTSDAAALLGRIDRVVSGR